MRCLILRVALAALFAVTAPDAASGWSRRAPELARFTIGSDAIVETGVTEPRRGGSRDIIRYRESRSGGVRWRRKWDGGGGVAQIALASDGDVVAVGGIPASHFMVRRLDARTGRVLWEHPVHGTAEPGPGDEFPEAVAVATNGDVIAAGSVKELPRNDYVGNFAVIALDGATGHERWRYVVGGAVGGHAQRILFDTAGNVIVGGSLAQGYEIVALSGATGATRWTRSVADYFDVGDLAIDEAGDVYVGVGAAGRNSDFVVMKLAGGTGAVAWTMGRSGSGPRFESASTLLIDRDAVFAAGFTSDGTNTRSRLMRLDAGTGATAWTSIGAKAGAAALAMAPNGSLITVGGRDAGTQCGDALVAARDPATGRLRWSRTFDGPLRIGDCTPDCGRFEDCRSPDNDLFDTVGVDAAGRIIVAGYLWTGTPLRAKQSSIIRTIHR